jgi:hypothetical protein
MDSLSAIFATVVSVLAAIAVVGALIFVIVWEVCAICRTLAEHRRRAGPPERSYWGEHAAVTAPEQRP